MNILITGIHGFVGGNLLTAFKNHHTIYGLDIISPQKEGIECTYSWNELKDVQPIDCIIHLAGKAHDTESTSSAQSYFDINVGLTQKIFDWFLRSNAKKFVFFSSVKAVADSGKEEILTEDAEPKPGTAYGRSKLAAERYILHELERWTGGTSQTTKGKQVYLFRPCMIHGLGNKGNLNLLYKIVSKGIPWPLGAYENRRSMLSVDNLAYIIQNLIEKDIAPGTYHLADDQPISTNEIIRLMAESMQRKAHIINVPKAIINPLARSGDLLHLPLNSERLKKLTESYEVSNEKIKKALGVSELPIKAHEGLLKTFKSFYSNE